MELNNSIPMLFNYAVPGNVYHPQEFQAPGQSNDRHGFQRASIHGLRSGSHHMSEMSQRIEKMASMLTRMKQASPELSEAPTVTVQSSRETTSSFTYSLTQDQYGTVTEEFSYKVQYKPSGETRYVDAGVTSAPANAELVSTQPVEETVAQNVEAPKASADPLTFDEHIAALIEYYRVATEPAPAAEEVVTPEFVAPIEEGVLSKEVPVSFGDIINIDGGRVARIYSGEGDDAININADRVRRIHSGAGDDAIAIEADRVARIGAGEGDDSININADKVTRVNSGAGDDVVNIEADKVRRINTGAGDDELNIIADQVARINTGEGDDTLSINADTITRINTGAGDDVLNLTADSIKRVDAGAGDDVITIDAEDAAIAFGKGGGEDVINITSVGALAIQIDPALAASSEGVNIVRDGDRVRLEFASGESLTINNVASADMISVRIGGESIDLHLSEPSVELDVSA